MVEARRRLTVIALSRLDDLARGGGFPPEVVERLRMGYESQLGRIDRRLEMMSSGHGDGDDPESGPGPSPTCTVTACRPSTSSARQVIAAERTELEHLLARRKVTRQVADGVRAALDLDEITLRP